MERKRTVELGEHVGERVCVKGWLHAVRRMGTLCFVVVRDGWGTVQAVWEGTVPDDLPMAESIVAVEGTVRAAPQAAQGLELVEPRIRVLEPVTEPTPLALGKRTLKASLPTLLDQAVIANRHPARRALFELGAGAMAAFRSTLAARAFTEIQSPKLVASATESGANVFRLDFFGRDAFLAQSPQFYKQISVGLFERVFEVGPVFRAEPHDTTRHLSEYVSLDVEFAFIEDHFEVMALLRELLAAILAHWAAQHAAALALLDIALPEVPATIPHLHFSEAQQLIWQRHGVDVRGEPDLSPQDERWLGAWARAEHNSDWLFVTGYPMSKRPFYTHPDPARPEFSRSFDLLFRGMELVTGGQRLHRHAEYRAALARAGLPEAPFAAYLDTFRYGMPPHGGFAIGLERLIAQLAGLPNVRLATLFPRDQQRLAP